MRRHGVSVLTKGAFGPRDMLEELLDLDTRPADQHHILLYSFGGLRKTLGWIAAYSEGDA